MKKYIGTVITILFTIILSVLGFVFGSQKLSANQTETLMILSIVCGSSVLYCFIVGEITGNNSQMDKLWSILPIVYAWIVVGKSGFNPRLLVMATLITIWGLRLTINFAKKGAYSIKFWTGEEDYRWIVLRKDPKLNKRWKWAIFDFFFISLFQNVLVLAITFPLLAVMESSVTFNVWDGVVALLLLSFIILETVADRQQMAFQTTKYALLQDGKKLEEIPTPYNKGFNTRGLWGRSRHPNYFSEQAIWVVLYFFTLTAGVTTHIVFSWTLIGSMVLIILFMGSSAFSEGISAKKYSAYADYIHKVSKYLPLRKYRD